MPTAVDAAELRCENPAMPVVDLVPPQQVWVCEDCTIRVRTEGQPALTPMHPCAGHAGFKVPMIPEGTRGRLTLVEREDYVGTEDVRMDADGRPIMRSEVERPDGHSDVWVYAPTAHGRISA